MKYEDNEMVRTEVIRLYRQLRKEQEDRRFWEFLALTVTGVTIILAGTLLAVVSAAGMI